METYSQKNINENILILKKLLVYGRLKEKIFFIIKIVYLEYLAMNKKYFMTLRTKILTASISYFHEIIKIDLDLFQFNRIIGKLNIIEK